MAKRTSAGLLVYRCGEQLEVFLVHPGGPFWVKKDLGAWSLPKGEFVEGEDTLEAAKREFQEETSFSVSGEFLALNPVTQPSKKVIYAWAVEADCDPDRIKSNSFSMEWPPKSGQMQRFPEVDRAAWFSVSEAKKRILAGQAGFIDQLCTALGIGTEREAEF